MPSITGNPTDPSALLDGIPPAPREPGARAKKLLFGYQSTQKQILIFGIAFFGAGWVLTSLMCWGLPVDLFISISSRRMSATMLDAERDKGITVNIFERKHPTILTFKYYIGDARYEGASATFDSALIKSAHTGATVDVDASRLYAGWSRVVGSTYCKSGFYGLIGLIFPGIGAGIMIYAVGRIRRQMAAYRRGVPIVAKVVWSGQDLETSLGGEHPYAVRWEFSVGKGVFKGEVSTLSRSEIEDLMGRAELPVLYDPQDPNRNTVYIP
jgi:hypothetical protein